MATAKRARNRDTNNDQCMREHFLYQEIWIEKKIYHTIILELLFFAFARKIFRSTQVDIIISILLEPLMQTTKFHYCSCNSEHTIFSLNVAKHTENISVNSIATECNCFVDFFPSSLSLCANCYLFSICCCVRADFKVEKSSNKALKNRCICWRKSHTSVKKKNYYHSIALGSIHDKKWAHCKK